MTETLTSPGEGFKASLNAFAQSFIDLVSKEHKSKLTDFMDDTIKLKEIVNSKKKLHIYLLYQSCVIAVMLLKIL